MPILNGELIVEYLTVGPFQTNVYVIGCARTRAGAIVDGGGSPTGCSSWRRVTSSSSRRSGRRTPTSTTSPR